MDPWLDKFAQAGFRRSVDTAHDLKTPLNVAVLSLELLRMRVRKLTGAEEDPKITEYARSIELELRRMAHIFDAYFLLSTPPNEADPSPVDLAPICHELAGNAGIELILTASFPALVHESRIRQAFQMFFEGATKLLAPDGRQTTADLNGEFRLIVTGKPVQAELELTKIFKFYYTDPLGNPDLSLAAARLIVETYGGELIAAEDRDKVSLRLTLPPGER